MRTTFLHMALLKRALQRQTKHNAILEGCPIECQTKAVLSLGKLTESSIQNAEAKVNNAMEVQFDAWQIKHHTGTAQGPKFASLVRCIREL